MGQPENRLEKGAEKGRSSEIDTTPWSYYDAPDFAEGSGADRGDGFVGTEVGAGSPAARYPS